MTIAENIEKIKCDLLPEIKLIAVSKTQPAAAILEAYSTGHRSFGENRAQEMAAKFQVLPHDIEWHFIGHLQGNKVKFIAPFVSLVQSVDSLNLLQEIDREAGKSKRIIHCLLQFHIAGEETKFGLSEEEAGNLLGSYAYKQLKNIRITGVMGMATFTDDKDQVREEFRHLKSIFTRLKNSFFKNDAFFCEISMGMSDDYRIAVEEGSTLVRIGSGIFGERNYY